MGSGVTFSVSGEFQGAAAGETELSSGFRANGSGDELSTVRWWEVEPGMWGSPELKETAAWCLDPTQPHLKTGLS